MKAPTARPVRVLYIGGLGRSGSTLLDRMLGQLPGFFSAGEVREVWQRGVRENRLCGCGTPFRECEVWARVGRAAFGGWDRIDVDEVMKLARNADRHSCFPLLLFPQAWPPFAANLRRYVTLLTSLYRAIRDVTESQTIIDSSKTPSSAFVLRQVPDVDLSAVHLIRDSRAVAYRWTKKVRRPDTRGRVVDPHRYAPWRVALRWVMRNTMMEILGRTSVPGVRVLHENLVTSPRPELERILAVLRESVQPEDLAFVSNAQVVLGTNHTVMGSPLRLVTGPVKLGLDEQWKTAFGRGPRRMVTALTRPLLRRYGYR